MMIRVASAAVIAALMSSAAFAQTMNPPPTAPDKAPPMAQPAPEATAPKAAPGAPMAAPMAAPNASASAKIMTTLPADAATVTNYYKQSVYDPSDNKIGTVDDVLVAKDGKIHAAMIGVGGFLGMGEKDVAVPFDALNLTQKNNKWYLTMNATKDELKSAPGWKYDRNSTTWVAAKSASNSAPMTNQTARK
jgi:sporulation protein YlmC with PRC-barrel domain